MRRLVPLALLVGGCASTAVRAPPEPPPLIGPHPAIGRALSVELEGEDGTPALVAPAPGRVLVACFSDRGANFAEGPCSSVLEHWRDRVTVIGIVNGGSPSSGTRRAARFRLFSDPERRTAEQYELADRSQVLVTDVQGRIAAVLGESEWGHLDPVLEGLLFGTDSWR